jgi:Tol biopolymer transport system component
VREIHRASSGGEEPRGIAGIALSPDGERLVFFSPNRRILSVMPSGGGKPRVVHRFDDLRNTNPEWTRDGRYVLIGGAKEILYLIPMDGGQSHEINLQGIKPQGRITVHPDGQQIAFTTQLNADSDADVWVMQNFLPESVPKK